MPPLAGALALEHWTISAMTQSAKRIVGLLLVLREGLLDRVLEATQSDPRPTHSPYSFWKPERCTGMCLETPELDVRRLSKSQVLHHVGQEKHALVRLATISGVRGGAEESVKTYPWWLRDGVRADRFRRAGRMASWQGRSWPRRMPGQVDIEKANHRHIPIP